MTVSLSEPRCGCARTVSVELVELPESAALATLAGWEQLADQVVDALSGSGLSATRLYDGNDPDNVMGAVVDVDPFSDTAGGVFVAWHLGASLADPMLAALERGHIDDPAIARAGQVRSTMIAAMVELLVAHEFDVEDALNVNDFRPLQIYIRASAHISQSVSE